jgi:DNA polymerase I-like protein with 3'-5' exonuclease and polymerase domains/uracil-DNA glycosylase
MIVGEAPGENEVSRNTPFVGASGQELDRMLHEARITRSECFLTNVCRERPPKNDISEWLHDTKKGHPVGWPIVEGRCVHPHIAAGMAMLKREVELVKPAVIIAVGNLALWALAGEKGILSWRGSQLSCTLVPGPTVVPIVHPASILREWSNRAKTVQDLRRVRSILDGKAEAPYDWNIIVRPSFETATQVLRGLLLRLEQGEVLRLSHDLETRSGHIACSGIAWSKVDAISIPHMCVERPEGYWTYEEECEIIRLQKAVLTHANARVVGQNYLYDAQYTYRWWGFVGRFFLDTMITHHTCFPGTDKDLGELSSLYCAWHKFWKNDGKEWNTRALGEDALWKYNGEDACRTWEISVAVEQSVAEMGLQVQADFQNGSFWRTLRTMVRGLRIDTKERSRFALELFEEIEKRRAYFERVLGHPLNPKSPLQMQRLFYEDLNQRVIRSRKTGSATLDDKALKTIGAREPILRPLLRKIAEFRSLGVFLSTFVEAGLDTDGRMRSSFNPAGTETFRYSSGTNAFWTGMNLQNIPKGGIEDKDDPEALELPNVRKLFVPDPGHTFFDIDLDRADLQVVVWEADDEDLRRALRLGIDLHCFNACGIFNIKSIPPEELIESHPNYKEHRGRIGEVKRQRTKAGVHATNYGVQAATLASTLGITQREAQNFIDGWLGAHPGIARWHKRTAEGLARDRSVRNRFGYRRYYFDRVDGILPEALGWLPQSTVANVINIAWERINAAIPEVEVLLQVHDSLGGQFPTYLEMQLKPRILELAAVTIPYEEPLTIPVGMKTSTKSWGDCK